MWDVVVIGAGPAGLIAALTLNHIGIGVLLLDTHGYNGGGKSESLPFDPREAYRKMILAADSAGIVPIFGTAEKILPLEGSLLTTYQGGEAESKCVVIACGGRYVSRFSGNNVGRQSRCWRRLHDKDSRSLCLRRREGKAMLQLCYRFVRRCSCG